MVIWHLFLRVLFIYVYVLISLRLMGKREIGKLSVFDVVVSIMIAEVSALALEETSMPFWRTPFIIAVLVSLQIMLSFLSLNSKTLRDLIEGRPTILISGGRIDDGEMRRTRYSMSDLMTQLREKDLASVADVEFAILETTGKLSVFPKSEKRPVTRSDLHMPGERSSLPTPIIIDGKVLDKNLESLGKTRFWLKAEIRKQGCQNFKDVFFASVDGHGIIYVDRKGMN